MFSFDRDPADAVAADTVQRLALMRRVAITMFAMGGSTAALGIEITARTSAAKWTQASCATGLLVCGLCLVLAPPSRRLIVTSLFASITILGVLMAGSEPMGLAPLFYLWPMVYAAYFCSPRLTAACMGWAVVTLCVGVALNEHHDLKVDTVVGTISSVGLMTALIATMTAREAALRRELSSQARTDSLTGLLSRRAFDHDLALMIEHAARCDEPLAVIMFDLDHFKQFNDRHGHLAGDDALRAMASMLRRHSRPDDAIGRFGGEEFTVALAKADLLAAQAYVDRVAQQLATADDERIRRLSTSAGISVFVAGRDPNVVVALADEALYAAKEAGRARYAWHENGTIRLGTWSHSPG